MRHRTHPGMAAEARRLMERSRSHQQVDQLAIDFARPFPVRPAVGDAEQLVAPVPTTIQAAYEAWRATADGERVVAAMLAACRRRLLAGEKRIGMKSIAEATRDSLKVELNNSYVSLIAREIIARDPRLTPLIQLRERKAT